MGSTVPMEGIGMRKAQMQRTQMPVLLAYASYSGVGTPLVETDYAA